VSAPWFEQNPEALREVEAMLKARYPTLHAFIEEGRCRIRGTDAVMEGGGEIDRYKLEIALPDDYPGSLPRVWETAGRIKRDPDRHTFKDGALCLGTPLSLWIDLRGDFSVERVLDIPVRNFLIGNSLVEEGEKWPHDERSHGAKGLLEHLQELMGTAQPVMAATFLQAMAAGKVTKHSRCPCQSGRKLFKCHPDGFKALRRVPSHLLEQTARMILSEFDPSRLAA
jgi:hypothetical protein